MLKSELRSSFQFLIRRTRFLALCLAACITLIAVAHSQTPSYTLQASAFVPFAVDPGLPASSNITVTANNGFSGTVDLACTVTSQSQGTPPTCAVAPQSVQPSANASVTVSTTTSTTPALYTITVTGTSSGLSPQSVSQNLTVLAVSPQFTITVQTVVQPSSVHAGSGGQGVISVNPINGYRSPSNSAGVTLSCSSVVPLVTIPPVCSFHPPAVPVNGAPATSTITISTQGPIITSVDRKHPFYAMWLPLPMLMFTALGAVAGGRRSRKAWSLLALFVVSGALLLVPACGNTQTNTTTPNGVTPNNSYTFTVTGVDVDGNTSSNTSTGSSPSVTLTVN